MSANTLSPITSNTDLIRTLSVLKQISVSINQLGVDSDLTTTLTLIANGAVKVISAGQETLGTPSAVIWIYDAARRAFDPTARVSAGEPAGASIDDFPRTNGLGALAVSRQRRLLSYEADVPNIHPLKQEAGAQSLVCYPLIVSTEVVGVLYVYRCDSRHFSDVELLILDNFVQLAGIAIHYGRQVGGLSQALARKMREMERLKRASALISSRTNLDETLQEILSIGLELTAAQYGSLEFYNREKNLLVTKALAGSQERPDNEPTLPLNEASIVGWVASRRQSLRIDDLHAPAWQTIYHPLPADREMRSELAVPIIGASGGLEGVLNIESPKLCAFSEEDQQLLEVLATQAGIAIQEIRLLDAMQEIVEVLLTAPLDDLLHLIIKRACDLINLSAGSIWLVSGPDTLVLRQSTEVDRIGETLSLSNSLTGQAVRLHQPIAVDDVRHHPSFQSPAMARKKKWISAIVVPLLAANDAENPVGSFSLYSSQLRDFSDWDKKLLTCLANHAAVAIRDAEQLKQLKQAQERQATAETIAAIGDVTANLLHQINNKVGAIPVLIKGIEEKCHEVLESWPYLARNLQAVDQSARQVMVIVRESIAPLQPVEFQRVDVLTCMELALQRAAVPDTITVHRSGLSNLPPIFASEKPLEMVFYNLIDNARKAMKGVGTIKITGKVEADGAMITVTDSGPGIPVELQPHIFEFSAATNKEAAPHLGFGLWWVKTFVNRFGGNVELSSRSGQGTTFSVWFPAQKEA